MSVLTSIDGVMLQLSRLQSLGVLPSQRGDVEDRAGGLSSLLRAMPSRLRQQMQLTLLHQLPRLPRPHGQMQLGALLPVAVRVVAAAGGVEGVQGVEAPAAVRGRRASRRVMPKPLL